MGLVTMDTPSQFGVIPIFPEPVGKLALGRKFTREEIDFVNLQPTYSNVGNSTSNRSDVLADPIMSSIRRFTEESLDRYFKEVYSPRDPVSLRITQSWLNYSQPGQYHHRHSHSNSFISGVLYVKAAKDRDKIYFYKKPSGKLSIPTKNNNLFNSTLWWVEVETGDLLLFPSDLEHSVANVEVENRISLSFNTFPVGSIGEEKELTRLDLT